MQDIFNSNNLGMPVKIRVSTEKEDLCLYGRFYGRGEYGESQKDDADFDYIAAVTPDNVVLYGKRERFIKIESGYDLRKLEYAEAREDVPYSNYLSLANGKYYKNYEYKKNQGKKMLVDKDVIGRGLALLLSDQSFVELTYQHVTATCEMKSELPDRTIRDYRELSLISFDSPNNILFYHKSDEVYIEESPTDSLFKRHPVFIDGYNLLISFGDSSEKQISIGYLENGQFIPRLEPVIREKFIGEVSFDNYVDDITESFLEVIYRYMEKNGINDISDEDMTNILSDFGIDTSGYGKNGELEQEKSLN